MPQTPVLSIVILNYNTCDLLKQTLESIETPVSHEIIVVDNASTDDSVEMVREQFPKVKLIQNEINGGFATGNNIGLRKARGKYLMLLNSDTTIQGKALQVLIDYLHQHTQVGIVTPKLVLSDGSLDPACHRGLPTIWNSFTYFSKLEKIFPESHVFGGYHQTWKDMTKIHPVEAVSGAAMMFPRKLLTTIGYLDEQFFMYAEDLDYCKRAHDAGFEIVYNPQAVVIHYKGQSGTHSLNPETRTNTRRYFYETMKLYFRKHYGQTYPAWVLYLLEKAIDLMASIRG